MERPLDRADKLRGHLNWQVDDAEVRTQEMRPAGGVMAGVTRYSATLGPFVGWVS